MSCETKTTILGHQRTRHVDTIEQKSIDGRDLSHFVFSQDICGLQCSRDFSRRQPTQSGDKKCLRSPSKRHPHISYFLWQASSQSMWGFVELRENVRHGADRVSDRSDGWVGAKRPAGISLTLRHEQSWIQSSSYAAGDIRSRKNKKMQIRSQSTVAKQIRRPQTIDGTCRFDWISCERFGDSWAWKQKCRVSAKFRQQGAFLPVVPQVDRRNNFHLLAEKSCTECRADSFLLADFISAHSLRTSDSPCRGPHRQSLFDANCATSSLLRILNRVQEQTRTHLCYQICILKYQQFLAHFQGHPLQVTSTAKAKTNGILNTLWPVRPSFLDQSDGVCSLFLLRKRPQLWSGLVVGGLFRMDF